MLGLSQVFSHRNAPEPTDGSPSPRANVPEGLTGPIFHPLSPLLKTLLLISGNVFPSSWMVAYPKHCTYLPTYLLISFPPSLLPSGNVPMGKASTLSVNQELAVKRSAFFMGLPETSKIGDLCPHSQGPFAKTIFVFSSLPNSSICASLPFFHQSTPSPILLSPLLS